MLKKILWASIWQSHRFMRNINTAESAVGSGHPGPKGRLNGNIWTSFARTIWYSAYCGAAWMLLIWKGTRSTIVSSLWGTFKALLFAPQNIIWSMRPQAWGLVLLAPTGALHVMVRGYRSISNFVQLSVSQFRFLLIPAQFLQITTMWSMQLEGALHRIIFVSSS